MICGGASGAVSTNCRRFKVSGSGSGKTLGPPRYLCAGSFAGFCYGCAVDKQETRRSAPHLWLEAPRPAAGALSPRLYI